MSTTSHLARNLTLLACLFAVLVFPGCSKKAPPEANAALDAALNALPQGDADAFVACVLPDQQGQTTSRPEWATFFQLVKSHEIDNEFDTNVTENSAMISTKLRFDEAKETFSNIAFVMKKADGKWYIDLNDTIKKENEVNPGNAFKIWTIEIRP